MGNKLWCYPIIHFTNIAIVIMCTIYTIFLWLIFNADFITFSRQSLKKFTFRVKSSDSIFFLLGLSPIHISKRFLLYKNKSESKNINYNLNYVNQHQGFVNFSWLLQNQLTLCWYYCLHSCHHYLKSLLCWSPRVARLSAALAVLLVAGLGLYRRRNYYWCY